MPADSAAGAAPPAPARPRLTRAVVLAVLGPALAFAVAGVDPLMLTLNLSEVSRGLDVPPSMVGFLAGAATLVVAAAVLAMGNLGDRYGLRRLLLWGLAITVVFDSLAALSPGYEFLIATRLLDGLGLAAMLGLSLALLTVTAPPPVRPAAIGVFMAVDGLVYGVTPLIGGWVAGTLGWRWLFLVAPSLALVAMALTARRVPAPPSRPATPLDTAGVVLFGLALLGLVYGVGAVPGGISQPQAWVPLAVCVLALAAFGRRERLARAPAVDLTLLRRPAFAVAVLAIVTVNLLAAGFSLVLGQFGGAVLALPTQAIGLIYLPGTLLLVGASVAAGRLVARRAPRPVLIAGLLLVAGGDLLMAATASPAMALWLLVLATWLGNLGYFVTATPISETILSCARPGKAGAVASVQPAFGMTGYALGPTIYIVLLNLFFQREWLADAQSQGLSVEQARHSVNAVTSSLAHAPGSTVYDPDLLREASGLALGLDYTNGVRLTMLVVTVLPLTVALLAFFLPRRRPRPGR